MPSKLTYRLLLRNKWFHITLACLSYIVTAFLSDIFSPPDSSVSPVWLPAGVMLALALRFGSHIWPGIWFGAFIINTGNFLSFEESYQLVGSVFSAAMNGVGASISAVAGAMLVNHFTPHSHSLFTKTSSMSIFIFSVTLLCGIFSSSSGVIGLYWGGLIPADALLNVGLTWWIGDTAGILLITPLLHTWLTKKQDYRRCRQMWFELTGCIIVLLATLVWCLGLIQPMQLDLHKTPLIILIALLVWPAFRFGQTCTFVLVTLTSLAIIFATSQGFGPFYYEQVHISLAELMIFLLVTCITTYMLSAAVQQNDQTLQQLSDAKQKAEDANKTKSLFLSQVSHELRTPLNSLLGYSQLLQLDQSLTWNSNNQAWLNLVKQNGEHLTRLIDDILDLSNIEAKRLALHPERVNINSLLIECMSSIRPEAEQSGIKLTYINDTDDSAVIADYTRLKQVILNLLSNALKYNTRHGSIRVSVEINIDEAIKISIEDTGLGIAIDQQAHIFELFNRAGRENSSISGTGIGLAINKRLIEAMYGQIGFESEEDIGSKFWITLPQSTAHKQKPTTNDNVEQHSQHTLASILNGKHVLYIEDNHSNQVLMQNVLRTLAPNAKLTLTETAEEGLQAIDNTPPDIVFMDIQLPEMDGYQALKRIRSNLNYDHIPVVALSADITHNSEPKGGFDAYLSKPIMLPKVAEVLGALLL